MATLAQKRAAERDARALLEGHGLPQPDEIEYGYACVTLIWREERVCLIVDIDEDPSEPRIEQDLNQEGLVPGY